MDRRVLRERMRRKQRQIRRRKIIKLVTYVVAMVLAVIFVIRGVIFPIVSRIGGKSTGSSQQVQADAEGEDTSDSGTDSTEAQRQPLKGQSDVTKVASLTPGWHEDDNGRWYQNADGTYYTNGFAEIDGVEYAFDSNGYMQTGWVTKGVNDYYFNDDGSYNPEKKRPLIALTFDDGPGQYTDKLLDCLEENNAHATFFMLGQNVQSYQSEVKRMLEKGLKTTLSGSETEWITEIKRTKAGAVIGAKVGGEQNDGETLRRVLGLRSPNFSYRIKDGKFIFTVKGYGNLAGMSLFGANEMAKEGKSYEQIITYYYSGTEIE